MKGCTAKSKALVSILFSQMQYIRIGLEGCTLCMEFGEPVSHLILGNQILLLRRLCVGLSGNCLGSKDVLLEKALLDQFLHVPSERPAIDGLVPFVVVVGTVLQLGE